MSKGVADTLPDGGLHLVNQVGAKAALGENSTERQRQVAEGFPPGTEVKDLDQAALLAIHRELVTANGVDEGLVYLQITRGAPGDRTIAGSGDHRSAISQSAPRARV